MTSKVSSGERAGDADDRLRREVEDRVAAGDGRGDSLGVAQVGLGELDLADDPEQLEAGAAGAADVGLARAGAVEDADLVAALEQRPRQVRADEAVGAGDQRAGHARRARRGPRAVHGGFAARPRGR